MLSMDRVFAALIFAALLFAARVNNSSADNIFSMTQTVCADSIEIHARTIHLSIQLLTSTKMAITTRFTRRQADKYRFG